jgi:hypothetical protein
MTQRKFIRFRPDPGTVAWLDPDLDTEFVARIPALVMDESQKGSGLVVIETEPLPIGSKLRIQVGHLSPLPAEIRWRVVMENQIVKIGVYYLE